MLCPVLQCPAMSCNATISNTKDKEVKFNKDTLMQKAYELSLWKIRDGDDTQSATSTGYHSQVREREREKGGERKRRERGGKETDIFPIQIQIQIQILFKIKIKTKFEFTRPAKKMPSDVGTQNEIPIFHSLS